MAITSMASTKSGEMDAFHKLVADLSATLESSSGNSIGDVDPDHIINLMDDYTSEREDWSQYAFSDFGRSYTRNLVDAGNGKSNLLVLVWTPGRASPIHDHADAHCVMKILQGRLQETLYAWPDSRMITEGKTAPLAVTRQRIYERDQVTYMSDQLGLHRISNPDTGKVAVSLHLYTPPNAARHGCHMFDEKTGRQSHVQQNNFFSEYGRRLQLA